jgi:hypothetical protein
MMILSLSALVGLESKRFQKVKRVLRQSFRMENRLICGVISMDKCVYTKTKRGLTLYIPGCGFNDALFPNEIKKRKHCGGCGKPIAVIEK